MAVDEGFSGEYYLAKVTRNEEVDHQWSIRQISLLGILILLTRRRVRHNLRKVCTALSLIDGYFVFGPNVRPGTQISMIFSQHLVQ